MISTTLPISYNDLCSLVIQLPSKLTAKSMTSSSSMGVSRVHLANHCYFFTSRANRTATPPTLSMLTLAPYAQYRTSFFFTSMPAHSNTSRRSCVRLAASACLTSRIASSRVVATASDMNVTYINFSPRFPHLLTHPIIRRCSDNSATD